MRIVTGGTWRRSVLLAACVGVLTTAVHAGGAVEQTATSVARGGTLRISSSVDPGRIDPAVLDVSHGWMLQSASCAKLYSYPDKAAEAGTRVIPEVATSFPEISKNGKTYTIELRSTYRFHTGQRVTAANYAAAFHRNANPRMQSPAQSYLRDIVGASAVIAGRSQTISGVQALGPNRLQIRTTKPLPDLVARLTMPFFCPIAVNTPIDPAGLDKPLGSGPYYVASRVPNRLIALERNPHYRGPRPANVNRIVWEIGRSREACLVAVDENALDYCVEGVPSSKWAELAEKHGINLKDGRFFRAPTLQVFFFAFNHDRPAFKGAGQIPLKQAINLAIDRPALARVTGPLSATRTDQLLPPTLGRAESIYPLGGVSQGTLRRARALLAKARLKPEKLVVYSPNSGSFVPRTEIFRFNLQRLGIDVDVRYLSASSWLEKIGTRGEPFDVTISGFGADYADPAAVLLPLVDGTTLRRKNNSNYAYYNNPGINRALERIGLLTGDARRKAWADLEVRIMRDDPPYAPFVNPAARAFVSESVGCVVIDPVGLLNLAAVCKK